MNSMIMTSMAIRTRRLDCRRRHSGHSPSLAQDKASGFEFNRMQCHFCVFLPYFEFFCYSNGFHHSSLLLIAARTAPLHRTLAPPAKRFIHTHTTHIHTHTHTHTPCAHAHTRLPTPPSILERNAVATQQQARHTTIPWHFVMSPAEAELLYSWAGPNDGAVA